MPDICIANFFGGDGKLNMHQDKSETRESIQAGSLAVHTFGETSCLFTISHFADRTAAASSCGWNGGVGRYPVIGLNLGDACIFDYGSDPPALSTGGHEALRARPKSVRLNSGDVILFGGKSRLLFHGVSLRPATHAISTVLKTGETVHRMYRLYHAIGHF